MMTNRQIARTYQELREFLTANIDRSGFQLAPVKISTQQAWRVGEGTLSHASGGFFHITGLIHRRTREEHLVLYQPQGALTGLALCKSGGTVHVLLQARVEPGNTGVGQYGPTIQSTPANYQRIHGGKATSCLELFNTGSAGVRQIATSTQLDLGKRYYQKSKSHTFVECFELLPTDDNMIWVPLPVIAESLRKDNFLNSDLRSLLGIFDWDGYQEFSFAGNAAAGDTRLGSALLASMPSAPGLWELMPVSGLEGWELTDDGVIDRSDSGISVGMYHTSCTTRETSAWSQPLMKATFPGLVQLSMRETTSGWEFLVTLRREFGVSGEWTLLPSLVIYPGESPAAASQPTDGTVVAEFFQSDEGGRFYQHESVHRLVIADCEDAGEDQYWISARALKYLLQTSDLASIQLRSISSLVIDHLNPSTFGTPGICMGILPFASASCRNGVLQLRM